MTASTINDSNLSISLNQQRNASSSNSSKQITNDTNNQRASTAANTTTTEESARPTEASVTVKLSVEARQISTVSQAPATAALTTIPLNAEKAADNILSFVSNRLQQLADDGVSNNRLEKALNAAERGFERGVEKSINALQQSGADSTEQLTRIDTIINRFNGGLAELREQFGEGSSVLARNVADVTKTNILDNNTTNNGASNPENNGTGTTSDAPVDTTDTKPAVISNDNQKISQPPISSPAINTQASTDTNPTGDSSPTSTPNASIRQAVDFGIDTTLQSTISDYQNAFSRAESISLQLQTQDGDTVTINFQSFRANFNNSGIGSTNGNNTFLQPLGASELLIEVDGEIDDDELLALQDLLAQLGEVSDLFFNQADEGSILNSALNLEIDVEQIASFTFDAQLQQSFKSTEQYRQIAQANAPENSRQSETEFNPLTQVTQLISDASNFTEEFISALLAITFASDANINASNPGIEENLIEV